MYVFFFSKLIQNMQRQNDTSKNSHDKEIQWTWGLLLLILGENRNRPKEISFLCTQTNQRCKFIHPDGWTDGQQFRQTNDRIGTSVHYNAPLHPYMGFGTWKWWALNHALGITIISIGPLSTHWPFPHLPVPNDKSEPKVANRTLELTMKVVMLTIYSTRTWKSFQIKCSSFQPLVRSTDPSFN